MNDVRRKNLDEIVRIVFSSKRDKKIFLIGGFVRDLLRGNSFGDYDIDFTVEGDASEIVTDVAKMLNGKVKKFLPFFTYKITGISKSITEIDFAQTRTEKYKIPGALPIVENASLEEDLKRRDFTINTLAMPIEGFMEVLSGASPDKYVIDLFKGREDLNNKIVRVIHPQSFNDDPTRIFRAARYVARLEGELSSDTKECLQDSVKSGSLHTVSGQRRWNEIKKILAEKTPSDVFRLLKTWEVFSSLLIFSDKDLEFLINALSVLEKRNLLNQERGIMLVYGNLSEEGRNSFEKESGIGKKILAKYHDILQASVSYSPGMPDEITILALVLCHRQEKVSGIIEELKNRGIII